MKVGGIFETEYTPFILQSALVLLPIYWVDAENNKIEVVMLKKAFPDNIPNVNPDLCASQEEVDAMMIDPHAGRLPYNRIIKGEMIGKPEGTYWRTASYIRYDHNSDTLSSYEAATPQSFIIESDHNGVVRNPIARHIESANRKSTLIRDCTVRNTFPCVLIMVPRPNAPLTECFVLFYYSSDQGALMNFEATFIPQAEVVPTMIASYQPKLKLIAPAMIQKNQLGILSISVVDPETDVPLANDVAREVFIETTAGYLPKRRVVVTNGGPVNAYIRALDLEAGDTIKVKIGWKHISGLAEAFITVTE